jgi:preprotein translocase subunit SecG
METVVWILHLLVTVTLVVLVLLQHGKGADMGAAFGSGASGSLFGASGSANFLSRATAIAATGFFLTSMGLTYFSLNRAAASRALDKLPASTQPAQAPQPVPAQSVPVDNALPKSGEIPK